MIGHPGARNRGSAILVALMMCGIIAFAMGVTLLHMRNTMRSTEDKMAYEEAYHAALSGINAMKAYIVQQDKLLAAKHLPAHLDGLTAVTSGSIELANFIAKNHDNPSLFQDKTASDLHAEFWTDIPSLPSDGSVTQNGLERIVLFQTNSTASELPDPTDRVIMFPNERDVITPVSNMFNPDESGPVRSYVSRIRVTTPYRLAPSASPGANGIPDDLRECNIIIESEGVALASHLNNDASPGLPGGPKRRVLQQKVKILAMDDETTTIYHPGVALAPGASIISSSLIDYSGASHLNIHWGPAWSKSDIKLLNLAMTLNMETDKDGFAFVRLFELEAAQKYSGTGIDGPGSPAYMDEWADFIAAGQLLNQSGDPLFRPSSGKQLDTSLARYPGTDQSGFDFFYEAYNNNLYPMNLTVAEENAWASYSERDLFLDGRYWWDTVQGTAWNDPTSNIFFDPTQPGAGALIERATYIAEKIETQTSALETSETFFRNLAMENGTYFKRNPDGTYSGSGLINADDSVMLTRISKKSPYFDNDNTNPWVVPDGILFIESEGDYPSGADLPDLDINSSDNFFWRGLMYLKNLDLNITGAGGLPTVHLQNPDWFEDSPDTADALGTNGLDQAGVFLDGILYTNGQTGGTGNAVIYGSVIARGGWSNGGNPEIFYNPRLKDGILFQPPPTNISLSTKKIVNVIGSSTSEVPDYGI